jgi:CobQ/CobB/MinD/ParA nucleotide binding domain
MRRVFAAISHKGGTGRSVTMANVATCAALRDKRVCVIDLDLASPTFGAVVGLTHIATGIEEPAQAAQPRSVYDILRTEIADQNRTEHKNVDQALISMWAGTSFKGTGLENRRGGLFLLPGRRFQGDVFKAQELAPVLGRLLGRLTSIGFDLIICDLRSGASNPFAAFLLPEVERFVAGYVFHFRWTPQHLSGLRDLLHKDINFPGATLPLERVRFVRIAKMPPEFATDRRGFQAWLSQQDKLLKEEFDNICSFAKDFKHELVIGEIPLDPVLQWRETIITQKLVNDGIAKDETLEAFDALADAMIAMLQ